MRDIRLLCSPVMKNLNFLILCKQRTQVPTHSHTEDMEAIHSSLPLRRAELRYYLQNFLAEIPVLHPGIWIRFYHVKNVQLPSTLDIPRSILLGMFFSLESWFVWIWLEQDTRHRLHRYCAGIFHRCCLSRKSSLTRGFRIPCHTCDSDIETHPWRYPTGECLADIHNQHRHHGYNDSLPYIL